MNFIGEDILKKKYGYDVGCCVTCDGCFVLLFFSFALSCLIITSTPAMSSPPGMCLSVLRHGSVTPHISSAYRRTGPSTVVLAGSLAGCRASKVATCAPCPPPGDSLAAVPLSHRSTVLLVPCTWVPKVAAGRMPVFHTKATRCLAPRIFFACLTLFLHLRIRVCCVVGSFLLVALYLVPAV